MPYWLKNEKHGVMPVYEMSEVERHKGMGWTLMNHGPEPVSQKTEVVRQEVVWSSAADPAEIPVSFTPPVRKKPGRPPKAK